MYFSSEKIWSVQKIVVTLHPLSEKKDINNIAEWQQLVARQAHNLEVVGSNPTSATTNPWSAFQFSDCLALFFFYAFFSLPLQMYT